MAAGVFRRLGIGGVFTPVLAKRLNSFSLVDCISIGVDRMARNFKPIRKQAEAYIRILVSRAPKHSVGTG